MTTESNSQFIRWGMRDRRVAALRERLLRAGVEQPGLPAHTAQEPAVFDDAVEAAVRMFQQTRGLIVDGVVGPETDGALNQAQYTLGDRPLYYQQGHELQGEDIQALQANLSRLGFYYGHLNGTFTKQTHHAVVELQTNLGLEPNGTVDMETIAALARINKNITSSKAYSLRDYYRLEQATTALKKRTVVILPWAASGQEAPAGSPQWFRDEQQQVTDHVAARLYDLLKNVGAHPVLVGGSSLTTPRGVRVDPAPTVAEAMKAGGGPGDTSSLDGLLVTLHCDWNSSPQAHGVATYYWGSLNRAQPYSPIGQEGAVTILKEMVARTGAQDLGSHARQWDLVKLHNTPTVWVDLGYLSNPDERERLLGVDHPERLAESILCGLQRLYVEHHEAVATGAMSLKHIAAYYDKK